MEIQQHVNGQIVSDKEYEQIADKYESSFLVTPYRSYIEEYSVLKAVGNVQGLQVLDVACGTGHYSRVMRNLGATRVVGTDLSPDMVRVARQTEEQEPVGNIEYHAQDAGDMETLGQFDLAVAIYLFHYATSLEHLQGMCHSVARNLRPGGRFVTYTLHPDLCREEHYYRKYRFDIFPKPDMRDGDVYSFVLMTEDGWSEPLTIYYWSWEAMEGALRQAGLSTIKRHNLGVSPEGIERHEPGFWQDYLDCQHCVILDAVKDAA